MNDIVRFISTIRKEYPSSEMPFLNKQLQRVQTNKPYQGLTILHNTPFTRETIVKLGILHEGGATITVTSPSFMEVDKTLTDAYIKCGGRWKQQHEITNETFDLHLDCAGELIDKTPPKIGTVEITATGTNKYGSIKVDYPIISVDKSKIKSLEGVLGTGEAFLRAFEKLSQEDTTEKKIMIFGYGKVGVGIAYYLKSRTENIIIVDKEPQNVEKAKLAGFESYTSDNKSKIENLASEMFAIVTATGVKDVISNNFDSNFFKGRYLANMGGEDEFGFSFKAEEVMCNKKPINFFIEAPTLMRYLDPVFYAHNLGVDLLLFGRLDNGLHPFPEFISEEVVNDWVSIFNEKVNI
ncbi:NAD-binding protein [Aquimarina sediminis]|uniref:NAD-binding protein n=1 Tax=Aquimarina sediminis TaxID=2070536 RepID=UPI000FFEFFB8|nr:NAD-binding protein [Aquimarina sediminis]